MFSFKWADCDFVVSSPMLKKFTVDCSGDYAENGSFNIVVNAPSLVTLPVKWSLLSF